MAHVELVHEELAVVDNKYVSCAKCQSEVVGMYYASTRAPGHNLCFRCYQADLRGNWWVGPSRQGGLQWGQKAWPGGASQESRCRGSWCRERLGQVRGCFRW